eukprot:TRINITY_DN2118_c2_g1_i2.p1 TRINITY_DN2118_c2_g1~~TRINITY_DN2118_c2_g1_i2.p1  ORF type:complete len:208 (-),score=25.69 TRINITY_DN2118_c2_g1_i2:696-1319(-)
MPSKPSTCNPILTDLRPSLSLSRSLSLSLSRSLSPLYVSPFDRSDSGTFREADFAINKTGLVGTPDTGGYDSARGSGPSGSSPGLNSALHFEGGLSLEDLEIVGTLGRGAGGVVEKAKHRPSGKLVALKVYFHPPLLSLSLSLSLSLFSCSDPPALTLVPRLTPTSCPVLVVTTAPQFVRRRRETQGNHQRSTNITLIHQPADCHVL